MKMLGMTLAIAAMSIISGCGVKESEVVIYTALDEMYSKPILERFEGKTGIAVKVVYDSEASKTTGLVNRLLKEKTRPRCDVFWNNEIAQTILLKEEGVLEAYVSPASAAVPEEFKDADGYWSGLAARGRVIIYNTDLMEESPTSIRDFIDPKWKGRAAIALPLFGTTATHAAALFAALGEEGAKDLFREMLANDVAILSGNATVRDFVAQGEYAFGLTDTDDANGAVEDGLPAKWLFPDQEDGGLGTLVIPNSVALIKNAPNGDAGRMLIDYLLSPEIEAQLARLRSIQVPLKPGVEAPKNVPVLANIRTMEASFEEIAEWMPESKTFIEKEFHR